MTDARVLVVLKQHGRLFFSIYDKDMLPSDAQARWLPGEIVYSYELTGRWTAATLDEIIAEYRRREAAGTLPQRKAKEQRAPEPPWATPHQGP